MLIGVRPAKLSTREQADMHALVDAMLDICEIIRILKANKGGAVAPSPVVVHDHIRTLSMEVIGERCDGENASLIHGDLSYTEDEMKQGDPYCLEQLTPSHVQEMIVYFNQLRYDRDWFLATGVQRLPDIQLPDILS